MKFNAKVFQDKRYKNRELQIMKAACLKRYVHAVYTLDFRNVLEEMYRNLPKELKHPNVVELKHARAFR